MGIDVLYDSDYGVTQLYDLPVVVDFYGGPHDGLELRIAQALPVRALPNPQASQTTIHRGSGYMLVEGQGQPYYTYEGLWANDTWNA